MNEFNPSIGRNAKLYDYATSDLSTEELLASGADIDDLVAAGVLEDDYAPNDGSYKFIEPKPFKKEVYAGPAMSEEMAEAWMGRLFYYSRMAKKYRGNLSLEQYRKIKENAPDTTV